MGYRVFTDTEGMREASNQFDTVVSELRAKCQEVQNMINRMEPTWKGGAAVEYIQLLRNEINDINNMINAVQSMNSIAHQRIAEAELIDGTCFTDFDTFSGDLSQAWQDIQTAFGQLFG